MLLMMIKKNMVNLEPGNVINIKYINFNIQHATSTGLHEKSLEPYTDCKVMGSIPIQDSKVFFVVPSRE